MKFKKTFAVITTLALALSVSTVWAMPNFVPARVHNPSTGAEVANVIIPQHAVELAPNVFSLGTSVDVDGAVVEGYAIVHPKRGYHHRPGHGGGPPGGGNGGGESKCFAFLAKDAKWKTTEPYVLNPANGDGMPSAFVEQAIAAGVNEWDSQVAFDIFGPGSTTGDLLVADQDKPDGVNEVYFGDLADENALAVTIVWGIFGGPPFGRELREWDMVFDDPDTLWGDATVNPDVFDFQNVTTHEQGHAAGMGHPDDSCVEETMYRFASKGETKKRDLNTGDITGITILYK